MPAAISLQEAAISSLASNSHSHPVRPVVLVDCCPPLKNRPSLLSVLAITFPVKAAERSKKR